MLNLYNECIKNGYEANLLDTEYKMRVNRNTLEIYFECSDSKIDWFHNLNFFSIKRGDGIKVHRGFYTVYRCVIYTIKSKVTTLLKKYREIDTICVVGYSHGAGLGLLVYEALKLDHGTTHNVIGYGFGCPRIFKRVPKEYTKTFEGWIDVKCKNDIVTMLPPKLFGFTTVCGKQIVLYSGTHYNYIDAHRPTTYSNELKHYS